MAYIWCKECVHRPEGKIEHIKKGKKEYIKFYCPLDLTEGRTGGNLYHLSDFDSFKETCAGYEPRQLSIEDIFKNGGEAEREDRKVQGTN